MARSRTSHDYVAEIEVAPEALVTALTQALEETDYSVRASGPGAKNSFLASSMHPSIRRHFIRAQPERLEWSVVTASSRQCRLTVDYALSLGMTLRLCSLCTVLTALHIVAFVLLDYYPTSLAARLAVEQVGGPNIVICVLFGTAAIIVCGSMMYGALLGSYRLWGRSLVRSALLAIECHTQAIRYESHLSSARSLIGRILPIYASCCLILPGLALNPEMLWKVSNNHLMMAVLAVVVVTLLLLKHVNRGNTYRAGKTFPTNANVTLALCIIIPLLIVPMQVYRIAKYYTTSQVDHSHFTESNVKSDHMKTEAGNVPLKSMAPDVLVTARKRSFYLIIIHVFFGACVLVILFHTGKYLAFYRRCPNHR